jgi:hypothetical protein
MLWELSIGAPIAALCLLWSCSISPSTDARVTEVEPAFGYEGEATEVAISGEGFALRASRDVSCGGAPLMVGDEFDGELGGEALEEVVWVDEETLTARVPDTLSVGFHDLVVITPSGDSVELEDAFEVRDPGGDSDSDTDVDSDTDADTDADADTDTDLEDGVECESAVVIDSFPYVWTGAWADFYSSFVPSNICGTGNSDVWFEVQVPGAVGPLIVTDQSATDVLVRHVASCTDSACIDYSDEPELLVIPGGPLDATVYVVVTEIDAYYHPDGEVLFELLE